MTHKAFNIVLGQAIDEQRFTLGLLHKRSGVPEGTLKRWSSGKSNPRDWRPIVQIAHALEQTQAQADRLLTAAGKPTISQLKRRETALEDVALLGSWQGVVLLPPPVDIVGRTTTIAAITETLQAGGISLIAGMSGVGKTALATHLANGLRPYFVDGVLWATLKDQHEDSVRDVLLRFARACALRLDAKMPLEALSQRFHNALSDKRMLIVLDDVANGRQIDLLRPLGTESALLLTAQPKPIRVPPGTHMVRLMSLESSDGTLELFQQYLGKQRVIDEREAFVEIAELIGNLPLAAVIIAQQLMLDPNWLAADFLSNELRPEHARLQALEYDDLSVRVSFNLMYQQLSNQQQRHFAELGVFDSPFSIDAAAHILTLSEPEARSLLRSFHQRALIEQVAADRYQFHKLLGRYAHDFLSGRDTYTRKIRYYIAYAQTHQHDEAALFAEIEQIRTALLDAQSHGIETEFMRGILATYTVLSDYGFQEMALRCLDDALTIARHKQSATIAPLLTARALLTFKYGHPDEAMQLLTEAEPLADVVTQVTIGRVRGMIDSGVSIEKGIATYRAALQLADDANPGDKAAINHNLAYLSVQIGDLAAAELQITHCIDLAKTTGNIRLHGLALTLYAILKMRQGNYQFAQKLYDKAFTLVHKTNNPRDLLHLYLQNGQLAFMRGDQRMAMESYTQAATQADALQLPHFQLYTAENFAQLHIANGQFQEAKKWLDQGFALLEKRPDVLGRATLLIQQATLLGRQDSNWDKAHTLLQEALTHVQASKSTEHTIMAQLALGDVYRQREQLPQAQSAFATAKKLAESGGFAAEIVLATYGLARISQDIPQATQCYAALKRMGHYHAKSIAVWIRQEDT